MIDLIVVPQTNQWHKLKALMLDSVSSSIAQAGSENTDGHAHPYANVGDPGYVHVTVTNAAAAWLERSR